MKNNTLLIIYSIMMISPSLALQKLALIDQQSTDLSISKQEFTRITIREDRIKQLFGSTDKLVIEIDDELGQIFIKPLDDSKKLIRLTLITENGLTHDLKLVPKNQDPESILFTPGIQEKVKKSELDLSNASELNYQEKIIYSLKDFKKQSFPNNIQEFQLKDIFNHPDLEVQPVSFKKYSSFHIIAYEITNISGHNLPLNNQEFYQPSIVAIACDTEIFEPETKTILYIIKQDNHETQQPLN